MQTRLYPRHLTNIARVDVLSGSATVFYQVGAIRTFLVSDEDRLVAHLQRSGINFADKRHATVPANRVEGSAAGQNGPVGSRKPTLHAKARASLHKVVATFQSGDLSPILRAVRLKLDPEAPATKWTLSNKVLACIQTGQLDCRGYRQWQAVGRQVKKGARAAYILRPRLVKKTDDSGEEKEQLIGFAPLAVFAAGQTEGDPLPEYAPRKMPPLSWVAERLGIEISYQPLPGSIWGSFSPGRNHINLGTHDEATWFHELAHAIHQQVAGKLKGGQDVHQETVAELTAAVLVDLYGLPPHTGNAWQYIQSYAPEPLTAITKALADVEKILAWLFERDWLVEAPSGRRSVVTATYDEAVEAGCRAFDCLPGELKVTGAAGGAQ